MFWQIEKSQTSSADDSYQLWQILARNLLAVVHVLQGVCINFSSPLLQPCGLCSRGIPACIYDKHHPEVSFADRAGVSTLSFMYEYNMHKSVCKRDVFVKKLKKWKKLSELWMFVLIIHSLSHNTLGVEGAEFLCSVLPSLPSLTSLRWELFSHLTLLSMIVSKSEHFKHLLWSFAVLLPKRLVCLWLRSCLRPCSRLQPLRAWSEQHKHILSLVWSPFILFPLIVFNHSLIW